MDNRIKAVPETGDSKAEKVLTGLVWAGLAAFILGSLGSIIFTLKTPWLNRFFPALRYLSYAWLALFGGLRLLFLSGFLPGMKWKALFVFIKEHVFFLGAAALSLTVFLCSHDLVPVLLILMSMAAFRLPVKRIIFLCGILYLAVFVLVLISSQAGWIENIQFARADGTMRQALGFVYPLETQTILVVGFLAVLWNTERYTWLICLVGMAASTALFSLTDSRTVYLLGMAAFLLILIRSVFPKGKFQSGFWKAAIIVLVCFCFLIPLMGGFLYTGTGNWEKLNALTSLRLEYAHDALEKYSVTAFGQSIQWTGMGAYDTYTGHIMSNLSENYNFVDCSYVKLLLDDGFVYYGMIFCAYLSVALRLWKKQEIRQLIILFWLLGTSIMDPRLVHIALNPFLFCLSWFFWTDTQTILSGWKTERRRIA